MSENTSGKFPTVFGYIAESERIALQRCVINVSEVPGDSIEIGSLNGLSALLTLSVLESHKMMLCVEKGQVETLTSNLEMFGFKPRVVILNTDFRDVSTNWKFSFVFIDHSHTHADNIAAFDKFWPLVSSGGILSFHDYQDPNWADGTRAIDELIAFHKLIMCDRGGSFIAFKKP